MWQKSQVMTDSGDTGAARKISVMSLPSQDPDEESSGVRKLSLPLTLANHKVPDTTQHNTRFSRKLSLAVAWRQETVEDVVSQAKSLFTKHLLHWLGICGVSTRNLNLNGLQAEQELPGVRRQLEEMCRQLEKRHPHLYSGTSLSYLHGVSALLKPQALQGC